MDSLILSTLGQAASLIQPIIEAATGSFLGNRYHELNGIRKEQKKPAQEAINSAFEEWVIAIQNNLRAQEYEESDLRQFFEDYKEAIEVFLNDPEVAEELLKPFFATTTEYRIDSKLLVRRWIALELRKLPEEFDVASVSRAYLRRVQKAGIVTSELRELFLAQLAQERTNLLQSIRGVWPDFDLDQYAERVGTRYQVLDLSALTPPSRDDVDDGRILLKDVFVPQMVRENRPPRELPKEILGRLFDKGELDRDELPDELRAADFERLQDSWMQAQPESVLTAVAKPKNNRLILLGDPGSGKSTLARYLLLSVLAESAENAEVFKTSFAGHLPLLVELRNYMGEVASQHCAGFLEYFHYLGKTQGYTLNHLELKEQLKTRPSLIIFDGLDEIFDPVKREKITEEIIGFALEYQDKARVLVTSRIIGYQGKALQAADFCEYTLLDFEPAQIKTFAEGWFNLVFRDKPEEAVSRYKRIETALQNSPAIRQLAGNPLLLTMIAIIAKHQELPRERAKLYEHATRVLCHHWDVTGHKIKETPADFMWEDDKLELLRKIAWRMQAGEKGLKGNFILSDDLHDEIAKYLENRWGLSKVEIGKISHTMIAQLRERNFILCLYGAQLYGFVHRTFLEYFCAAEIVYRFEKQQTLSIEELKTDIFLAHFRDETWHEVLRLICGMIEPRFTGELVEFLVSHAEIEIKDDFVEKLESNPLKELVFAQTCLNEANKPVESTVKLLYSKLQDFAGHEDWSVRKAAVESLAEHYQDRPEIYSLLQQVVQDDKHEYVRRKAVKLLAKHYQDRPGTYSLLQQVVQDDKHEYVRRAAVWSLAKHYQDRPEVLPMLQQIIIDDEEASEVRRNAVGGLASISYDNTWQVLLSGHFIGIGDWDWLDSKALIDEERVEEAAETLKLSPKTIRQHYEDIAKEIPLRLSWKEEV